MGQFLCRDVRAIYICLFLSRSLPSIHRFADRDMALRYSNMGIGHQVSNTHSASVDKNTDGPSVDDDIDDWVDGSDERNDKEGEGSDSDTDVTTRSGSGSEDEEDDTSGEDSGEVDDSSEDGEDEDTSQ